MLAARSIKPFTASTRPGRQVPLVRASPQIVCSASHQRDGTSTASASGMPTLAASAMTTAFAAALLSAGPAQATVMDASTAHLLGDILRPTFMIFTLLYIVRIPMTWYPNIDGKEFPW